jgi:hypothetical protein
VILVRIVCQASFGKSGDVVAGFSRSQAIVRDTIVPGMRVRLLTDLSGPFDTVVLEMEMSSLGEWERLRAAIFSNPRIQEAEAALPGVIASGRTEYYTIDAEWR